MKIWLMNHYAVNKGRHYHFAHALARLGHEVTLFSVSFRHNDFKETKDYRGKRFFVEQEGEVLRVWVKTPPYRGNSPMRLLNQLSFAYHAERFGKRLPRPDIVIGSSVHLFTGEAASRLARHFDVPFIFEVRDLWPQTLIDIGAISPNGITARYFGRLERSLYEKADRIISVLPQADRYIISLGIDPQKIVYIPNGVNLEWFDKHTETPLTAELEDFFRRHSGRFMITYTGAMGLANGLDTVVDAAALLQEKDEGMVHLLLVGDGPQRKKLERRARERGLKNITFWPRVEKEMIPAILKRSHACLFHLKRTDVFKYGISSNKLFDYLASGRPLLYAFSGNTDFAGEARCGPKIPAEDPEAMAGAMLMLSALPEYERQRLGTNGRLYVEENHDLPILAERLLSVINGEVSRQLVEKAVNGAEASPAHKP